MVGRADQHSLSEIPSEERKMLKKFVASMMVLAASSAAFAQVTVSMNSLGLNDGTYNFDLILNWADGDDWTTTGVRVDAMNGAVLEYNFQNDGNGNALPNAGPGAGSEFHTFMSTPLPPAAGGRFNNNYAGNLAGGAIPAAPTPTRTANEFNVALFDTAETPADATDRAVQRTALNVAGVAGFDGGNVYFSQTGPMGANDILVGQFQSLTGIRSLGAVLTSFDGEFYATGIPEPASLALIALGGLVALRRR